MLDPLLDFLSALKNPAAYLFAGISVMVFAPDDLFFIGPLLISVFLGSLATYLYKAISAYFHSQQEERNKRKAAETRDLQVLSDYDSLDDSERDAVDQAILTGSVENSTLSDYQMINLTRKRFGNRLGRNIYNKGGDYFRFQGAHFEAIAEMKHPESHRRIKKRTD